MRKFFGEISLLALLTLLFSACSSENGIFSDVNTVGLQSSDSESDDISVYPIEVSEEDEIPEVEDGVLYFQKPDTSKNRSSSSRTKPSSSSVKSSSSSIVLIVDKKSSSSVFSVSSSSVIPVSSSSSVIWNVPESSSANAVVNEWDWDKPKDDYLSPDIYYWRLLVDPRDGQEYYTVKIGDRWWMAQNLNYNGAEVEGESWCYGDVEQHCEVTGRLYTWDVARDVCPEGWRLPYPSEWDDLITSAGGSKKAGRILKSSIGWLDSFGNDGNGTDSLGFSAIPAGWRDDDGRFNYLGKDAYFWVFSGGTYADYVSLYYADRVEVSYHYRTMGFSVRCIEELAE